MSREDMLKEWEAEGSPKTASKEQPLLMSTPMVQALLNGTKTETRRDKNLKEINENPDQWAISNFFTGTDIVRFINPKEFAVGGELGLLDVKCPWRIGNILWVKETWKPDVMFSNPYRSTWQNGTPIITELIRYKADLETIVLPESEKEWFDKLTKDGKLCYKSSMFMRRKFARIFLKITDIKLERLHDITEEGAIAEGIERFNDGTFNNYRPLTRKHPAKFLKLKSPIDSYKSLWESINGEGSWDMNIWCWVVKFEKLSSYENKVL